MMMLRFLYYALLGILSASIQRPAPHAPSFAIYLIDHPEDYGTQGSRIYGTRDVSEIALEAKPLISDADILSYDLRQHSMKLTKEAVARIPRTPSLHGLPFVVVANGDRIYLGVFNRNISSIGCGCPTILVDRNLVYFFPYKEGQNSLPEAQPDNTLVIDRSYPQGLFAQFAAPDPRSDPRIVRALTQLHKLKAADEWLVWRTGRISDEATPLSSYPLEKPSSVLDHYLDNLLVIHPELKWDLEFAGNKKLDPKVSMVGRWHDFDVYDVIEKSLHLKQIVLESPPGMYRILYSLATGTRVVPGPSKIVTVQGKPILVTSSPPQDPERFYEEKLFLLDEQSGLPTELNVEGVIGSALWEFFPDKLWLGKAVCPFDLQTLTYQAPVYKDGDPECCPTGGSVEIRLGFQGSLLVPIYKKYDPTKKVGDASLIGSQPLARATI
jgi:hypothetical protein